MSKTPTTSQDSWAEKEVNPWRHFTPRPVLMHRWQRARSYLGRQITDKRRLLLHIALLLPTDILGTSALWGKIHLLPQHPQASYTSNSCCWSSLPGVKRTDCAGKRTATLWCGLRCWPLSPNSWQYGLQLGVATLSGSPLCTEEGVQVTSEWSRPRHMLSLQLRCVVLHVLFSPRMHPAC